MAQPFKRQSNKMVKHTQTIRRQFARLMHLIEMTYIIFFFRLLYLLHIIQAQHQNEETGFIISVDII